MPDPMLGLISFVGLLAYGAIGGVVGSFTVRLLGVKDSHSNSSFGQHRHLRAIAGAPHGDRDGWQGFGAAAVLWPVCVAAGAITGVCYGPYWLAKKCGVYTAAAILPGDDK